MYVAPGSRPDDVHVPRGRVLEDSVLAAGRIAAGDRAVARAHVRRDHADVNVGQAAGLVLQRLHQHREVPLQVVLRQPHRRRVVDEKQEVDVPVAREVAAGAVDGLGVRRRVGLRRAGVGRRGVEDDVGLAGVARRRRSPGFPGCSGRSRRRLPRRPALPKSPRATTELIPRRSCGPPRRLGSSNLRARARPRFYAARGRQLQTQLADRDKFCTARYGQPRAASVTPGVHIAHWTAAFSQMGGGADGSGTTAIVWPAQSASPAASCQHGPAPPVSVQAAIGRSTTLPLSSGEKLVTRAVVDRRPRLLRDLPGDARLADVIADLVGDAAERARELAAADRSAAGRSARTRAPAG